MESFMHWLKAQFRSSVNSCLRPLRPLPILRDKHIVFVLGCLNLGGAERQAILLAQMLPLMNSTPIDFHALQLVHKHGGYWVYKVPAA